MKLSAIIISNKESVSSLVTSHLNFADEVLVIKEKPSSIESFAGKRNLALQQAKGEWVLFVDDDEIVSRELGAEITKALAKTVYSGFYLWRKDVVFGQVLKFGEVGKVRILRLAKRGSGNYQRDVHETWNISGKVGNLREPLYHIKDNFISQFTSRISLYGPLDAISLNREKKPFTFFRLLVYPLAKFIKGYIVNFGFLDGYVGLFLAYLMSVQSLSVRVFQWENQK